MLGEPKFESRESAEQKLVRLLKDKGVHDPEANEFLDKWTREQEMTIEQAEDYPLEQIQFNLRRARLYFKAGYVDEALEDFEDARTQAWNEQRTELYEAIMKEIDKLE